MRLIAAAAALEHMLGRHADAHARLQAALADLPADGSPEAVTLMLEIGRDGFYRMDYAAMRVWARRALEAARALGDRPLTAAAAGALALGGRVRRGDRRGRGRGRRGRGAGRGAARRGAARHLDFAVNALAASEILLDHYAAGGARAEWGIAVAEATGQGQVLPLLFWTGTIRTLRGRLREAAEILDTAIEIARVAGHEQGLMWNLFARSFTASAAGDTAAALALAREIREPDARDASAASRRPAPATRWPRRCWTTATPRARSRRCSRRAATSGCRSVPAAWRAGALELLTRILLALGRRDDAARAAAAAQACAGTLGLRSAGAMADRAAAAVALHDAAAAPPAGTGAGRAQADAGAAATGRFQPPGGAATLALRSAAAFADVGAPVEAALSRALAGRALAAAGETERAAAELERPPASSSAARRSATATPASASCGGSAGAAVTGARGPAATARSSARSPSASCRSRGWSSTAGRTPRSPPSCTSRPRPSRPTCAICSTSSASPRASKSPARRARRAASPQPDSQPAEHGLAGARVPEQHMASKAGVGERTSSERRASVSITSVAGASRCRPRTGGRCGR